jgi:hypothetical protein
MSQRDIFRKYLDILNEDGEAKKPETPAAGPIDDESLSKLTIDPDAFKALKTAIEEFQESLHLPVTGEFTPETMAAYISSGRQKNLDRVSSGKQQGADATSTDLAEGMGDSHVADRCHLLECKAALHHGFGDGLLNHEHMTSHAVGTPHHSHYSHGHLEGLKEAGTAWHGS